MASSSEMTLPPTHRALVQEVYAQPPVVKEQPVPQPTPGSAIVRILVAGVISYMRDIYDGTRKYSYPTPLTLGTSAIGRVVATGLDATSLVPGQLVHIDCTIRGRDEDSNMFLLGIHEGYSEGSRKLMRGEWRNATFAEYAKMPLENLDPLDEEVLTKTLGYQIHELITISRMLVPFGGLRDIRLEAGETVIVAPATGGFGGAAVEVALAMGARVIAMGRNEKELERVKSIDPVRVETVQIVGDVAAEVKALQAFGTIDAFFDISPPFAAESSHLKSAFLALRRGGRLSFMGGLREVTLNTTVMMHRNIQIKGKWMYERDDIRLLIRMVERGILRIGKRPGAKELRIFPLEGWSEAFDLAVTQTHVCVITP
jgi:NADPH:quinone reductase-like Zn-dependent oxidoreductase